VTAPNCEIGATRSQRVEHFWQNRRIVLQVRVHGDEIAGRGTQHSLDAGACQAAPADPVQAADAGIVACDLLGALRGTVGAVVIDDDDFPGFAVERGRDVLDHHGEVVDLVEGRDDNRYFGRRRHEGNMAHWSARTTREIRNEIKARECDHRKTLYFNMQYSARIPSFQVIFLPSA
jgi:hypothetical protein